MSTDLRDLLKGTLSLTSVLSLLSAVAVGVWVCANTLNDIKNDARSTSQELVTTKRELSEKLDNHSQSIYALQNQVQDVAMQQHDTKLTLTEIQEQMSRNHSEDVKRNP